jgi:peptidoglycan hydrolase-like protein with peptidoglycan-binding domain
MRHRIRRVLGTVVSVAVFGTGLVALDVPAAQAAYPVPPTPSGLSATIEAIQPYVGQSLCNPVAKPGVAAFRNLLLRTYTDSGSLGIVRDCGVGGQSEHKEGRAFDWAMSAYNSRQKAEVSTLLNWLLKTDQYGNKYAMARRFGIMYMIWNHHIFKLYDADRGWQDYSGPSPHTDHVHFSFGWNGARQTTSYWDRTVAPIDFGPNGPPHITPVRKVSNIPLVRQYGGTTLAMHSSGSAVTLIQKALLVSNADGDFGSGTGLHVMKFQVDQKLPVTGRFGPAEWKALFPFPIAPFGAVDAPGYVLGNAVVRGWAIDADTQLPVDVSATLDGSPAGTVSAAGPRSDVTSQYPEWGGNHGFEFVLPVTEGTHQVCLAAHNAPGTPGTDTPLGCSAVTTQHNPVGGITTLTSALGTVRLDGWAFDPDSAAVVPTSLTVDGRPSAVTPTAATRTDIGLRFPGIGDQHGVQAQLDLAEGSHAVCLLASNATDTLGSPATVACSTVKVEHSPVGALEVVRRVPGGVLARGWALDPDTADAATVVLLSDGQIVSSQPAALSRGDLPAKYAPQGPGHGFAVTLDLPVGTHHVCARVPNAPGTAGTDLLTPCTDVTVSHDAAGIVTALRAVPGGGVLVSGDAYDPDVSGPATVTVLVDGTVLRTLSAWRPSATAATRWPGYGTARAFAGLLSLSSGRHTICLRAENAPTTSGAARVLRCAPVVVHDATGGLTSYGLSSRTVIARGWALDPDRTAATSAFLVVDRRLVTSVTANRSRSDLGTLAPGYGSAHGYVLMRTLTRGRHTVCVVVRNLPGTTGSSRYVGCRSVTVA